MLPADAVADIAAITLMPPDTLMLAADSASCHAAIADDADVTIIR